MSLRIDFLQWCTEQLGKTSLWAAKGPREYDCSGLVTDGFRCLGAEDWRATHNTDRLWAELEPVLEAHVQPGDLAFWWAPDPSQLEIAAGARAASERGDVEHVAVVCAGGKLITADGATHRITNKAEAVKAGARVRIRDDVHYRPRFAGWRRFPFAPDKDGKPVLVCAPREAP